MKETEQVLHEYVHSHGVTMRVNREEGIIHGVKILGLESRNGRNYAPEALDEATIFYEGAKVNINHPKGDPTSPRDYQDRLGNIRNVIFQQNAGLFADLYFNPHHFLAEQLIWDAEHSPKNVGFSHNVRAITERVDGKVQVKKILCVNSVDLVADPATTTGLFESWNAHLRQDSLQEELNSIKTQLEEMKELIDKLHLREDNTKSFQAPTSREQNINMTQNFTTKDFVRSILR
ncbi:MAG: hypothetical protein Q4C96_00230 [Planctomycetia bacterium]|nr:hypothetical protein [Planctomycetia bacterium]